MIWLSRAWVEVKHDQRGSLGSVPTQAWLAGRNCHLCLQPAVFCGGRIIVGNEQYWSRVVAWQRCFCSKSARIAQFDSKASESLRES